MLSIPAISTLWQAHQALPRPLRVQWIVPGSFLFIVAIGLLFSLPPGPLCDEGMVLFMEGGCDMGESNVFFFSKLGLLVVLTLAFALAWRQNVRGWAAFLPHFIVGAALTWGFRSGGRCDTYYSHPNGSIGQMIVEIVAFSAVAIILLNRWAGSPGRRLSLAIAGWHLLYGAAFYAWLMAVPHWAWSHSLAVSVTMLVVSTVVSSSNALPLTKPAQPMELRS